MFRLSAWDHVNLGRITKTGTPSDEHGYAKFKLEQRIAFLFPRGAPPAVPDALRQGARRPTLDERIELIAQGRFVQFFHHVPDAPIDWRRCAITGGRAAADRVWCDVPTFLPEQGDIRAMWEPARCAWAIDLARSAGSLPDAAELYWRWVDDWMQADPPFQGVHWCCGQEASVRMIALALGFWSVARDDATTELRLAQFARLAWATGYRVREHIGYAISQKNNHALSEACGLLLIAQLFPEFEASPGWEHTARDVLAREMRRQIYADGAYVQHSMNYQRVMVDVCVLALRLAELAGRPFERDLYDLLARSAEFLYQHMESRDGRLPNYGNNDAAHVLPLSECEFADFRPAIQSAYYLATRRRMLPAGPWDEPLLWLFGDEAMDSDPQDTPAPRSSAFDVGGYYTLRRAESWAMIRCHTYRDRPVQRDALHVDLCWRGCNVLRDSGSYLYYTPDDPRLERFFISRAAHNTIELDQTDPFDQVSRFLFFPWPVAKKLAFEALPAKTPRFEGESLDYDRHPWRVLHRRALIAIDDSAWIVVDDLLGVGEHDWTLRWHLADGKCSLDEAAAALRLSTDIGDVFLAIAQSTTVTLECAILRGVENDETIQGWESRYYAARVPAPTLVVSGRARLPLRILTTIGLGASIRATPLDTDECARRWRIDLGDRSRVLELAAAEREAQRVFTGWQERGAG